jgi:S1-C subfamily serine protease
MTEPGYGGRRPAAAQLIAVLLTAGCLAAQPAIRGPARSEGIAGAVRQAQNSVVSIQTVADASDSGCALVGSGFLYGPHYVVTRLSVIVRTDSIEIAVGDGRTTPARLLQYDEATEIAVLEHGLDHVIPVRMGESSNLAGGSQVAILGNSLGIFPSVTLGRFIGRRSNGFLEIDGVIPAGNCGSPVLDAGGKLVGMIVGRLQDDKDTSRVTGIAMPVETIRKTLNRVQQHPARSGWIGISVVDLAAVSPSAGSTAVRPSAGATVTGVRVVGVVAGGPADKAEIAVGDTIVRFMGNPVHNAWQVAEWVKTALPQSKVTFSIRKGGREWEKPVLVTKPPRLQP